MTHPTATQIEEALRVMYPDSPLERLNHEAVAKRLLAWSDARVREGVEDAPIIAALLRRVCQAFDTGGESARSVRARCAETAFMKLHQDRPSFHAEYAKCDADPVEYLRAAIAALPIEQEEISNVGD